MNRAGKDPLAPFRFEAIVLYWRGPSPFFFAPIPLQHLDTLKQAAKLVTYGWGMVPVDATIGTVTFATSLFPKDETYLLPLKADVRRKTNITAGDSITVEMAVVQRR